MTELDRRSTDAGRRVLATAERLKAIAYHLLDDELGQSAAGLADRGAQRLERFGHYLEERDGEALVRDAERLGRERPWVVATGGFLIGFAGSRMLKASAAQRYGSSAADAAPTSRSGPYGQAGDTVYGRTSGGFASDATPGPTAAIGGLPPLSSEPMPIVSPEPDVETGGLFVTGRSEGQLHDGS